jgi:hypothetical protein
MPSHEPAEVDQQHPAASNLSPPHPHLARYLAPGAWPLDGEQLCTCGHLEGDHLVIDDRCSRCAGCDGFLAHPADAEPTQPGVAPPTLDEMAAAWRGRE